MPRAIDGRDAECDGGLRHYSSRIKFGRYVFNDNNRWGRWRLMRVRDAHPAYRRLREVHPAYALASYQRDQVGWLRGERPRAADRYSDEALRWERGEEPNVCVYAIVNQDGVVIATGWR